MKLHNKKTGEIKKMWKDNICLSFGDCNKVYYSLKELNEEWEDYATPEPLIKDEKVRKAVRAWAEANRDVSEVIYEYDTSKAYCEIIDNQSEARIRFNFLFIKELDACELYTIAELCGEDEK